MGFNGGGAFQFSNVVGIEIRDRDSRHAAHEETGGHLRVEHGLGQFLKREQVHGLLVEFVHSLLAAFGGGFKHGRHRSRF